eukprot:Rmarinus@m.18014
MTRMTMTKAITNSTVREVSPTAKAVVCVVRAAVTLWFLPESWIRAHMTLSGMAMVNVKAKVQVSVTVIMDMDAMMTVMMMMMRTTMMSTMTTMMTLKMPGLTTMPKPRAHSPKQPEMLIALLSQTHATPHRARGYLIKASMQVSKARVA